MPKRALVTGVSSGLGEYLAGRLIDEGWDVLGLGRRPRAARAEERGVRYLQIDLAGKDSVEEVLAWCGECPQLIVHNAAIYPSREGILAPDLDGIESVFRVNAIVPYMLTLRLLERQVEGTFCSVVLINSDVIYHADHESGVYAASKAASRIFATSLASSCRSRNVGVSTLLLGPLADEKKITDLRNVAERRGVAEDQIVELFLRRSNPSLVIRRLIDFESCFRSLRCMVDLGVGANGMLCRLDGGSAGSLV